VTGAMRNLARRSMTSRPVAAGAVLLAGAVVLVAAVGVAAPWPSLLRGWLLGFAIWSSIPIGSMTLLLIHRLTGGRWGLAAEPVLRPASAMMPMTVLAFLPLLVSLSRIYPWAADPVTIPHDVARWYLNGTSFALRSIIALSGWTLLGVIFAAGQGSRLVAGLGLAFYGLTISLIAVDWYLSLEPHYVASAFAVTIAVQQMLAALALTAILAPTQLEGKVAGDIGGLLIAMLLGVVYLAYMTFVVAWYGDLPDKAAWFLKRSTSAWSAVLTTALLLGAVLPFAMLLLRAVRTSRRGLRIAGSLILAGTALHFAWLIVPGFDDQLAVVAAALVVLIVLTAVAVLQGRHLRPLLEARHAE
jgi:hypothetical protein